jgi:hypothetical protein
MLARDEPGRRGGHWARWLERASLLLTMDTDMDGRVNVDEFLAYMHRNTASVDTKTLELLCNDMTYRAPPRLNKSTTNKSGNTSNSSSSVYTSHGNSPFLPAEDDFSASAAAAAAARSSDPIAAAWASVLLQQQQQHQQQQQQQLQEPRQEQQPEPAQAYTYLPVADRIERDIAAQMDAFQAASTAVPAATSTTSASPAAIAAAAFSAAGAAPSQQSHSEGPRHRF